MAASNASENFSLLHQHSTSNVPAADTAHWLGLPHNGQSGAWTGVRVMEIVAGR